VAILPSKGRLQQPRALQGSKEIALLAEGRDREAPRDEPYALGDQCRRAAYSVALNLAEGASRRGPTEFRRYLDIARSSLHEVEAILELAIAQGYVTEAESEPVRQSRASCARMVYGLLRKMTDRSR